MSTIIKRMQLVLKEYREKGCTNAVVSIEDMERLLALAATSLVQEKREAVTLNLGNMQGLNRAKSIIIAWRGETHPPEARPFVNKHADRLLRDIEEQLRLHER